jgi:Fic family protein
MERCREQFDQDEEHRNLQIEAAAHVRVEDEVDRTDGKSALPEPASVNFIRRLHREFYRDAPEGMLRVTGNGCEFLMGPGDRRSRHVAGGRRNLRPVIALQSCRFRDLFC